MKKILFLLLSTVAMYGQVPADATPLENIQITNNTTDNSATKVNVQSTDGTINTISKSDLVNVVEVNDVPSLPLVGEVGKIYVVKNVNKIYRWNGTFYQELTTDISGKEDIANKQNSLAADGTGVKFPTVDATNAGLSTKVTSTGTTNYIQKSTGANTIGNSSLKYAPSFSGINGEDLILGSNVLTASSARLAVGDNIILSGNGHHAIGDYSVITQTNSDNAYASIDVRPTMYGTLNWNHFIGFQSRPEYVGSGNITARYQGGFFGVAHYGTGNVLNHNGIYINDIIGTGPVTDSYGLKIGNITKGSSNNFAIQTGLGIVDFGGLTKVRGGADIFGLTSLKTNTSKTDTSSKIVAYLGQSNDVNYSALQVNSIGAATASERKFQFQTIEQGVASDGMFTFQPFGGVVLVGKSTSNGQGVMQVEGNITASPATLSNQVVVKSQLDAVKPYKVYTALLSQSGTSAPVATVLENTLGGTVVWSYVSIGQYRGTLTGAFLSNKTVVFLTNVYGKYFLTGGRENDNSVMIGTQAPNGGSTNGDLSNSSIEIRVYL